jgi:hypothetical protein
MDIISILNKKYGNVLSAKNVRNNKIKDNKVLIKKSDKDDKLILNLKQKVKQLKQ